MGLPSLWEEGKSWVVTWHRSPPSQSRDQMLSKHNAEIAIDAIGCIHWGKLGSKIQCSIYSSIHRSIACIPAWFGHGCPPCSGIPGGTTWDHSSLRGELEPFIQQSRGSPRDWILSEVLTTRRAGQVPAFWKRKILHCPNNQISLVNKPFHLNTAQELYTSCSPYLSLTLLRGLESKKQ